MSSAQGIWNRWTRIRKQPLPAVPGLNGTCMMGKAQKASVPCHQGDFTVAAEWASFPT